MEHLKKIWFRDKEYSTAEMVKKCMEFGVKTI